MSIVWWTAYVLAGVWAQYHLPGVDFLLPGFVVSLQEERWHNTAWLAAAMILLQEGMGTLFFGSVVLVYGFITLSYMVGRSLFDSRSITLVVLLGALAGAGHFLLSVTVLRLEAMLVPTSRLFLEGVVQAVLTPVLWFLVHSLFPKGLRCNERAL